jgi:hypothetical protein
MPIFDDRFARQNRCEPPPEFPLASPYTGIVRNLSGPSTDALTQVPPQKLRARPVVPPVRGSHPEGFHFHCAVGFDTLTLAAVLDSLVRVSRRDADDHYASIRANGANILGPQRAVLRPGL